MAQCATCYGQIRMVRPRLVTLYMLANPDYPQILLGGGYLRVGQGSSLARISPSNLHTKMPLT